MSACLISDLHLQENRPELTKAFKKFLVSHAANVDSLYILGDLFEAWIGDDYENDFITEVKFELKKYSSLGKKIYLMHGNRDFLLGDKFCDEIGGVLLDDPTTIKINDFNVILMHGDSLCTDDLDYQSFRTVVRDQTWKNDFLEKEISERIELAQSLREVSKVENKDKAYEIMDVNLMAVNEIFQKFKNDILIHGHTHRPKIHQEKYGTRYVLGDWEKEYYFLKINETIEFINEKIE